MQHVPKVDTRVPARPLGLHQITAVEAAPPELVSIAAAVGCQEVCVFTNIPNLEGGDTAAPPPFPLVTEGNRAELVARLRDSGVRVANIEFFSLTPGLDVESYRHALALGAELGARCAVTHIMDPDKSRIVDQLGRLADIAAQYSLDVALEFMGLSPACNSLGRAVELVRQVRRRNTGIAVDLLHLVRTGGVPADVAELPAELIKYAQLCDGAAMGATADYLDEALHARMVPGAGCFPVREFLNALPAHLPIDIEVPRMALQRAGVPALERAREAVAASRHLFTPGAQQRNPIPNRRPQ
ncbi:MAG: sugar phosphate isomerase/epimerase family protein [Parahaliea sp.]